MVIFNSYLMGIYPIFRQTHILRLPDPSRPKKSASKSKPWGHGVPLDSSRKTAEFSRCFVNPKKNMGKNGDKYIFHKFWKHTKHIFQTYQPYILLIAIHNLERW